ncbi:hypothetical protein [Thermococcus piezophilus]|uniref:hypothetical protein n=1 Tax=Thermococcus piezophilus TaxID=1712654 RepID=UPI001F18E0C7|nr:hypothetical protein [Thermococcus piezophilus]
MYARQCAGTEWRDEANQPVVARYRRVELAGPLLRNQRELPRAVEREPERVLEILIEAYGGDKDLDKIPAIMERVGDMIEDILQPLKELLNELYSPERIQAMGRSVAEFYKNLTEAGMDKDAALELTREYMDAINPGKKLMEILANFGKGGFGNITIHGGPQNSEEGGKKGE